MTPKKNTLPPLEETIAKAQKMVTEPITSSTMSPASPVQITPPTPGTQATSMLGEIQSSTDANNDAFQRSLQQDTDRKETNYLGSSKAYFDMLNSIRGEASLTSEAYAQEGGVDTVQTELNDINQQIRNEQRALDNTVRNLEEKGGGLQGGMQAEINNARRQSLRTQADLYVIQQGVQGKYDSAKAIADRAVSAYLEDQRLELDALKFNYDENKDLFTTAEQREFDVNFDTRKRALDKEEVDLKTISDLSLDALANGAPKEIASQMRQASSVREAMEIGGQYIGLMERQRLQSELASEAIARRKSLIDKALAGDKDAMSQLGIDPNAKDAGEKVKVQDEVNRIDAELATVSGMLSNETGLKTASGAVQSPFLSSFGVTVPTATALGAGAGTVIPGLGTLLGGGAGLVTGIGAGFMEYNQQRSAQKKFLADAEYMLTNMTANKVRELKESGVAFTPMTDKDIQLIGKAATKLEGYAIRDNGTLEGFTDEEGARNAIIEMQTVLQDVRDREMRKLVTSDEIAEIESQKYANR